VNIQASGKVRKVNSNALFTQGFLCVPDPGPGLPAIHQLDHAVSNIRLPEHPDQRFHAVEVAHGAAIYVHPVMSPDHAVEIAAMFANAIATVGFTGTITACADTPGPRPRTGRYAYSSAICSVDAALDNAETPLYFRAVMKNLDRWAVGSPVFKDIVDLLLCEELRSGYLRVQVLGPGHAGLQPVGFWTMTPLSAGRRMFTAEHPDDWWTARGHAPAEGFHSLRKANEALLSKWA
jgi:hypothetical protein